MEIEEILEDLYRTSTVRTCFDRIDKQFKIHTMTLNSVVIGSLKKDSYSNSHLPELTRWTGMISIPSLSDEPLEVDLSDFTSSSEKPFMEVVDAALANLLKKVVDDRDELESILYKHCMKFLSLIGMDDDPEFEYLWSMKDSKNIWKYVNLLNFDVYRFDESVEIILDFNCDWEEEHGVKIHFFMGKEIVDVE